MVYFKVIENGKIVTNIMNVKTVQEAIDVLFDFCIGGWFTNSLKGDKEVYLEEVNSKEKEKKYFLEIKGINRNRMIYLKT